ncbi:Cytosolic endo-beta-N-acetylglucosaminidase [Collichthys lucidus]|uniref:mannosyl-glycoprotein endo-beta-N-acetylglucosaminidase n=1 Tax=Collichthys lucidus TaxID=240159 RepID=A0A4U5VUE0_COLLU|nr:Cytosolic endo-beta-N-acetylglucosaminidase [Collichthys lucidus]
MDADKLPLRRKRQAEGDEGDVAVKERSSEGSRLESCLDQPEDSDGVHEVVKYTPSTLPAKHYDADTTEPISCGLETMDELLSWKRSEANPFNVAAVSLARREPPLASSPRRTLVSHDMMGGYLDDRVLYPSRQQSTTEVQHRSSLLVYSKAVGSGWGQDHPEISLKLKRKLGTDAEAPYAFYHWQYIDIFNYFTHKMVTIPPAMWTNAAHKHGVVVIGTFITEWSDGAVKCEAFLKDEESYRAVADKLVQISHYYGFDGWLVNIENTLSEVAVKNTPLFLRYLTDQMHERMPGSLVLWYDSVIEKGCFSMLATDSSPTTTWTEQNLEWMAGYSGVEGRKADVYIGVDVFARGKVVGGMFETNKVHAVNDRVCLFMKKRRTSLTVRTLHRHWRSFASTTYSTAIFAPGWVYEAHDDKTEFRKNQDKFWALLSDHLYVHRPASPLPFISSFCQGFGKAFYWRGQREEKRGWFNLSTQEIQPLYYHTELEGQGWLRSRGCPEDAWNGGCSLLLEGLIPATHTSPFCAKVFSLNVPLASKTLVALIYKPSAGITISLELKTTDASLCTHLNAEDVKLCLLRSLAEGDQLASHFSQLCGNLNPDGWIVRCSQLELSGCALREVCFSIQRDGVPQDTPFTCRVGEIMLLDVASMQVPPEKVKGLCIYDVVWLHGAGTSPDSPSTHLHLNATLRWDYPPELVRHFRVYWRRLRGPVPQVPEGHLTLVGRAYSNLFRITELAVPEPGNVLELVVEPVTREGFLVPESHWGRRRFSYKEEAQ